MPLFDAWDVVKVPFPYTNHPLRQRRPALVIHSSPTEDIPHLLWVLMITSAANRGWPSDVAISDLAVAGLPASSIVRTAKVATIEASDAERIGKLPAPDRPIVTRHLRAILAAVVG
ncbi:MAG: type II toxin-antitoxin system PemK/MazF family toxin [Acetobacteraceae bacterium]